MLLAGCATTPPQPVYDVLIRGGTIYDGSGSDPIVGDVAIKDDKIFMWDRAAPSEPRRRLMPQAWQWRPGSSTWRNLRRNRAISTYRVSPDVVRCCRSSDIRTPRQIITVITADPPKLTRGSGMPTTGARPITIIRLIDE